MPETKLIVDGHVHFYGHYDPERFFDAAIENLNAEFHSLYPSDNKFTKLLLFTEGKQNDFFSQLKKKDIIGGKSEYKFKDTQEDSSIILLKNGQPICYILAGRQIVTREKLEVLSIASNQKIEDGLSIEEVVKGLLVKQTITVLAWGVGKWFFRRGKVIKDIIEKYHSPYLFIGDNSARPSFWSKPKLYNLAERYNVGVLSGSDPLPFSEEVSRVGTFGFIIEGDFQVNKPAESFRNILVSNKSSISLFGHHDDAISFLKRQAKNTFP